MTTENNQDKLQGILAKRRQLEAMIFAIDLQLAETSALAFSVTNNVSKGEAEKLASVGKENIVKLTQLSNNQSIYSCKNIDGIVETLHALNDDAVLANLVKEMAS
ncbi:MAG: hypothetical protein GJ680_07355 [Alteromonadaceae bacterium]|nr:hypothetical protein [Alteromonadaceae bacterium]